MKKIMTTLLFLFFFSSANAAEPLVESSWLKKNINNLADYKNTDPSNLSACILDRPRHKKMIEELKELKVKITLIKIMEEVFKRKVIKDHQSELHKFVKELI